MKKNNVFLAIIIAAISIALVVLISTVVLDNSSKINEGNFRINDAVINSTVDIKEKQEETEIAELSNMVFDISQENKLSLLITKKKKINNAYIDNISFTAPIKKGNMYLTQSNFEDKFSLDNEEQVINIYPSEKDDQYYVELNIINENCVVDAKLPNETKLVKFDGTILELLNMKISDFVFDLSFDFNIIDTTGKKNTCKVKLNMPSQDLITDGISIIRQDLSDYNFKVK